MLFNVTPLLDGRNQAGIVVAVFLGLYIKRRFFKSKRNGHGKWKAPFAQDSRKEITPLVTEQAVRDEILKKAFTKELATEKEWDAIVIGSGPGGLSAAAILSKAGMKVLVLEKHGKCGGTCHIFKSEGYEFDVGIHYVGEFNRPTITRTLLEQISDGQIQWADLETNFDVVIADAMDKKRKFSIPSGRDAFRNDLIERFPEEKQAITKFFSMVNRVRRQTKAWVLVKILPLWVVRWLNRLRLPYLLSDFFALGRKTVKEVVESLTSNPDLQMLFTYSFGTYATQPDRASFALQALLHSHYEMGASYPVGGSSEIPFRIVPVIERSGGRVLMKAPVSQILIDEFGRAVGVRVGGKTEIDIYAPIIISDAGIHNTMMKLLPEPVAKTSPLWPLTRTCKPGIGCLSVFIGLRGSSEELGLKAQNVWAFTSSGLDYGTVSFAQNNLDDILYKPFPVIFIGSPSAKDPSWETRYPGQSNITVVTFASYAWFSKWADKKVKKRGDDYKSMKDAIGQQIVDQVVYLFPQLKDAIDHVLVGTPLTQEHYLSTLEGSIYGYDHDIKRFMPDQAALHRSVSGIDGLYLVGQDVLTCGFTSALNSGLLCASAILSTNLMGELVHLHKKIHMTELKKQSAAKRTQ